MVWTRLFNPEATTDQYEAPAIILLGFLGVYTEVWSMQYDVLYSYPLYSLLLSSVFSTLHLPSVLSTRILCTPILPSSVFSIHIFCTRYSYPLYSLLLSPVRSIPIPCTLLLSSAFSTPTICSLYSYKLYSLLLVSCCPFLFCNITTPSCVISIPLIL